MNLDLGILWIEDSYSAEEEQALRRRVQNAGFVARIHNIPNGDGVEELSRRHQLYHLYDIILLDYRLKDENGDDLAPKIRLLFPSVTVLFYSGSASEKDLRLKIAKKNVEGVYCSGRDRFIDRAGSLIDQTARSLDRLSGMRGLAMRVVAECDELMKSAVLSMSGRDPNCADKLVELDAEVVKFMEGIQSAYETAKTGDLRSRLDTRVIDSMKLFGHFRRLTKVVVADPGLFGLSQDQVERLRELRKASAQYDPQVLKTRNVLGHVIEVEGDQGWILQGSNEIAVGDFPDIRRTFSAHIDAFREMNQLVTLLDPK